jgi:hypothetical protein
MSLMEELASSSNGSVANFCRGRTKTLIGTSSGLSDRFELEPLIENLDRLGQRPSRTWGASYAAM